MTLIIICTKDALQATNELMRSAPWNATGDNVSIPVVIETATKDEAAQFYSTNWECFSDEHFTELKKRAKDIPGLYVYDGKKEKGFDILLKRLRIKRKEQEFTP